MTLPMRMDACILGFGNTSTTALANGDTFTGEGEQNFHAHFAISCTTDQSGTLYVDFSNDGTNWDSTFPVNGFTISANTHEFHTGVKLGRYFRVRLVNDSGANQTYLRLYTYFGNNFLPSNAPFNQSLGLDSDAIAVRPSIPEDEVVLNRRSGVSHYTKFAYRDVLTAANGEETIWNYNGNFTVMTSASTFTITYNSGTDGEGTNGALSLSFDYLDSDGIRQTASHTLGSTGSDVTAFSGLGINRAVVLSSGSDNVNTSAITITETTGATVQAYIGAGDSVTQQAIYHVDYNSDAIGKMLWIKLNKLSGGSAPRVIVKGYVYNRGTSIRYLIFRELLDAGTDGHTNIIEPVGFKLSPRDVLYFVADTDTNNTELDIRFSFREYKRT